MLLKYGLKGKCVALKAYVRKEILKGPNKWSYKSRWCIEKLYIVKMSVLFQNDLEVQCNSKKIISVFFKN